MFFKIELNIHNFKWRIEILIGERKNNPEQSNRPVFVPNFRLYYVNFI
jgi:hypothetical protein